MTQLIYELCWVVQTKRLGVFLALKTIFLPSSTAIYSFQLIVNAFPSAKVAESFRRDSLLEENLPIITLEAVGILRSKSILSPLLSPKKYEDKALWEEFLETEEVETLPEECLAIW